MYFPCVVTALAWVLRPASSTAFVNDDVDPNTKRVNCISTTGSFSMEIYPSWSPIGTERFLELVDAGFFTEMPLIRAVDNFLVQFGVAGDPKVMHEWKSKGLIKDDPNLGKKFQKGYISYAGGGKDSRDTSVFIADSTNPGQLDAWGKEAWETPFGKIVDGMDNVDKWYRGYGDFKGLANSKGVNWDLVNQEGNAYIKANFPKMDFIHKCEVQDQRPFEQALQRGVASGVEGQVDKPLALLQGALGGDMASEQQRQVPAPQPSNFRKQQL